MNALNIIPPEEFNQYGGLPHKIKVQIDQWLDAVQAITNAPKRKTGVIIRDWATRLHISQGHLRRVWDNWRKTGDWKVFVNRSKAGVSWWNETERTPLPPEFLDDWCRRVGRNQRGKALTAWRGLIRDWKDWKRGDQTKRIPGYEVCPPDCGLGFPAGWSYETLNRKKTPRVEMAVMTVGLAAALKLLPPIPGTRVGTRFLEYVSIDDVWQDRKVIVPGYPLPVRMLQMGAMDYASAVYLKFGLRPELPLDDGSRERLKEKDAKLLIAMFLEEYGYPADYDMHIVCERGTATIREADARVLYDLSGGRIKVCYTSMEGGLVLVWQEAKSGNSKGKAWHESWHNLFHNEMATLPGQVGKDNEHQPAALKAMEKEARSLATMGHFLTSEQKQRMGLPFSDLIKAHWETLDTVRRINLRRDHDCEGFDTLMDWVLPGVAMEPQPEGALLNLDAAMLERVIYKPRLESPMERLMRLSHGVRFCKLPNWVWPRFYEDSHALEAVKNFRYSFTKAGRAYVFKPANPDEALPEDGRKLLGYYNPHDPETIHLTGEDGAYIATWVRERRVSRGDQKAVAERINEKMTMLNNAAANVRRICRPDIEAAEERLRNNLQIASEAGLVPTPGAPTNAIMQPVCPPGIRAVQAATEATAEISREQPPLKSPFVEQRPEADGCMKELLEEMERETEGGRR